MAARYYVTRSAGVNKAYYAGNGRWTFNRAEAVKILSYAEALVRADQVGGRPERC